MTDQFGRNIDYLRVSVTDRCNLRCRYCMPDGVCLAAHEDILRYEEILRICEMAVRLGITKFKVTGGEPLARRGCVDFIRALKALPGVEQVTLTTNGLLLATVLNELEEIGIDGINISLDSLDGALFAALSGGPLDGPQRVLACLDECIGRGIRTKVNAVLLEENRAEWPKLAALAARGADVRFIEKMPIGPGRELRGADPDEALRDLQAHWPDLHPVDEARGNGPARYFASAALKGRIGVIDAVSHKFCSSCNRVRLTSTGRLKPCLCYDDNADLRALVRGGAADDELLAVMRQTIYAKPRAHCFDAVQDITERRGMNQIGG